MTATVLVIEDDPAIRQGLVDALSFAGHRVVAAPDGEDGLRLVDQEHPDLVLLDVMLPGLDGFEVLAAIRRARRQLPVIMVTARGAEDDRVTGLVAGADDYVVKPFSARELLARVDAVLRRSPERPPDVRSLRRNGTVVQLDQRTVRRDDGSAHDLTDIETRLLDHLAGARGRAVDRDELLRHVWGLDPTGLHTRTVDMHIARLREKLGDGTEPAFVLTVRGKGYRLGDAVEVETS